MWVGLGACRKRKVDGRPFLPDLCVPFFLLVSPAVQGSPRSPLSIPVLQVGPGTLGLNLWLAWWVVGICVGLLACLFGVEFPFAFLQFAVVSRYQVTS